MSYFDDEMEMCAYAREERRRIILRRTSRRGVYLFPAVFKISDAARSQIISSSPQCTSHCRPTYPRSRWACWVLMNEPNIKLKYGKSCRGYRRNILPWELLESLMTNGTKRRAPSDGCCLGSRINVSCDSKFLISPSKDAEIRCQFLSLFASFLSRISDSLRR